MSHQIYLAARYSRREELLRYAATLDHIFASMDWKVQATWLQGSHQWDGAGEAQAAETIPPEALRFAEDDWRDVCDAEVVICFTEEPRSTNSRGGRHVEFGIALGMGKRVFVVGHRENVFCLLPQVTFVPTWSDLICELTMELTAPGPPMSNHQK